MYNTMNKTERQAAAREALTEAQASGINKFFNTKEGMFFLYNNGTNELVFNGTHKVSFEHFGRIMSEEIEH